MEIQNESLMLFENILPILGIFHTAFAFLSLISWRFKAFGFDDLAVAVGMFEHDSVDDAIKVRHYKKGMQIPKLKFRSLAY